MKGATTYTPDAGGSTANGYKLNLGFMKNSWLAVQFVGQVKSDVLLLQIDDFYTRSSNALFSGHQITITDYYKDSNGLHNDLNNDYDISAFSYSNKKEYNLQMIRYQGSNSGQDWNAPLYKYSITQVCFYTANISFNKDTWNQNQKQCYYYQIQNFISTYRGAYLKQFTSNGYTMTAFGQIGGPYLYDQIFLYTATPLYTYRQQPALVLQLGTTDGNKGQDYHVWSPNGTQTGDYYGNAVTSMTKDNAVAAGFNNAGLTGKFWNAVPANYIAQIPTTNLLINFNRSINTYDQYDKSLLSTFKFCLYIFATGSINGQLTDKTCDVVQLSYHYPRQYVQYVNFGIQLSQKVGVLILLILFLIT